MIIPVTMSNNYIPAGAVLVRLTSENGRAAVMNTMPKKLE
jgi:hypothetical protein